MDVIRILSDLRSEREKIEEGILCLERSDRPSTGTTERAPRSVTEIRRIREPDDDS